MRMFASFSRKMNTTVKIIFNIPDYARYVQHQQEHHPGEPVMTEKEFYMRSLHERYESGKVNRCC
ncbi:YbdD/YjiX family protein [Paenibacillus aestuarii]|uniref:YbdD/YjiX family protein n=1 Tax=Paenibacillus aestuarii TaxID=516965 RepID=A0ABW0K525_9BACL|nr:YbdD/YjiX family protein [Paenibacillus aestuarii]